MYPRSGLMAREEFVRGDFHGNGTLFEPPPAPHASRFPSQSERKQTLASWKEERATWGSAAFPDPGSSRRREETPIP